jgi:hypothetical protein
MCQIYAIPADLMVLVQLRHADRVTGYVATGALASSDAVVVPSPPPPVLDQTGELEVLIAPYPLDPAMLIERLEFCQVTTYALRDQPPIVAILKLASRSRYGSQVAEFDPEAMAAELERNGGSFRRAMESTKAVPTRSLMAPGREELAALQSVEEKQRVATVQSQEFKLPPDMLRGICNQHLFPCCVRSR